MRVNRDELLIQESVYTPSEGRVVSEGLDTHGLAGGQQDNGGVTRLDELGVVLS